MSLKLESHKIVGRTYLRRLLDQTNEDCCCSNCTFCVRGKLIQAELFKNGYQTFNKEVKCWKINETASKFSVSPSDQWSFAVVVGFGKIKDYLSLLRMSVSPFHQWYFAVVVDFGKIKNSLSLLRMLLHAISLSFCSCFSIWWNKGLFVVIFVRNFSYLFSQKTKKDEF